MTYKDVYDLHNQLLHTYEKHGDSYHVLLNGWWQMISIVKLFSK